MIKISIIRRDEVGASKADYDVLAHAGSKLVGSIGLQIRQNILVGDAHASCGLIGLVDVHKDHRMQGIAQMMLKEAMGKLSKEKVDIAMLATDVDKLAKLYAKVGFVVLGKKYYFYNSANELCESDGGMIASVSNRQIFDLAMLAKTKINIGPSNV